VLSAFLNGLLLPFVLIYALLLVNDTKLMGDYTNPRSYNYISWGTVLAIVGLTVFLIVINIFPSGRL
jgi:Mn2+/Fe2+ NRAMP family transporter